MAGAYHTLHNVFWWYQKEDWMESKNSSSYEFAKKANMTIKSSKAAWHRWPVADAITYQKRKKKMHWVSRQKGESFSIGIMIQLTMDQNIHTGSKTTWKTMKKTNWHRRLTWENNIKRMVWIDSTCDGVSRKDPPVLVILALVVKKWDKSPKNDDIVNFNFCTSKSSSKQNA